MPDAPYSSNTRDLIDDVPVSEAELKLPLDLVLVLLARDDLARDLRRLRQRWLLEAGRVPPRRLA